MDEALLDELCPMLDPTALPRILSRAEAVSRGFAPHVIERRLAAGRWQRLLPRTYLTVPSTLPLGWMDRITAALAFAGPESMVTGSTALAVAGIRCVPRLPPVVVLVPRTNRCRSRSWVRIRRTDHLPEPELDVGPRRVSAARAAVDHGGELRRLDDARALVSELVRRRLGTVSELGIELEAGQRNGSAFLRRAIGEVTDGSWSAPEARAAWLMRRNRAIPAFEQNARIVRADGRCFVVDFLWRDPRAVLEIDSLEHHFETLDWLATMDRHRALETLGYSVAHWAPSVVCAEPRRFVAEVAAWLAARTRTRIA